MKSMIVRNLKVFFRDRTSVFFSLLGAIIIIGLYVLFLGDVIQQGLPDQPGTRALMDSWIMAGVLTVATLTTCMGAFGTMVDDRSKKILKDFSASPLKRSELAGSYVIGGMLISLIISLIILVLAEIYIVAGGGALLPLTSMMQALGVIALAIVFSGSLVFFIVSLIKSLSAFATLSTIVGTLSGFLTGIYISIGMLPTGVQWAVKLFPLSHAGALLRQIFMAEYMKTTFVGAPAQTVAEFEASMGVVLSFGTHRVTPLESVLMLALGAVVFFGLAVFNVSRKKS